MLGDLVRIVDIFHALALELIVELRAVDLEILVRHFGVKDGQSIDPHSPSAVFVLDGMVQQNAEDGEHHVRHFLLVGILK